MLVINWRATRLSRLKAGLLETISGVEKEKVVSHSEGQKICSEEVKNHLQEERRINSS